MAFKSNDRTFEKVYGIFDKRDYFNAQGLAKTQIGNFERALKKNDKGAQQILDKFKGDMGKAKDYITQVITDRKKEQAFNDYKAFKVAVDSIQKGKPQYGAVDLVKSRIHNSSQKYTIALYSALRNKKFTKWKDVHNDVDSLLGESVDEGVEPQIKKIAYYTGTRPEAVEDFVSKHSLNITKLLKYVEKGGLPQRMELVAALAGRPNNPKQKKIIKTFQEQGVPQGYNPTVENKKEVEQIAKKTKSETAFYDVLSKIEKKYGKRNYRIWLEKSLKDLGVNAKHYDYRTNAAAEEKLYQLTK